MGGAPNMLAGYESDHVFHFEVTPPEWRPRWFLEDVPDFVRICHPKPRGATVELQFRVKRGPKPGPKGPETKALPAPKPKAKNKPRPKRQAERKKPVPELPKKDPRKVAFKLFTGTEIVEVASLTILRRLHKRQVVGASLHRMNRDGFHVFKDGAVAWLADRDVPFAVKQKMSAGLLARATEMKAKGA